MRILGGKYKGKNIKAGASLAIRPLTNRLKESIFNVLDDFIHEKKVLDLFAGSGSLGIEAYSRGAKSVTFVENSRLAITQLKNNLHHIGIPQNNIRTYKKDVITFCQTESESYDLIFTDPPFNFNWLQNLIDHIMQSNLLQRDGLLLLHHEISNPIQTQSTLYRLFKQKQFGRDLASYIIHEVHNV
jgi:16S rRNA (guanine966-N2)-methyltransferase